MIPGEPKRHPSRLRYAKGLSVLLLLFCFRVSAQLLQAWSPVSLLPSFEAWASGALPYWLLVIGQGVVIAACFRVIWRLREGTIVPSARAGKVLLVLGSLYFGMMCVRLVIGLTVAPEHFWFGARLPTLFHLVLASFMLTYGRFHIVESRQRQSAAGGGFA